MSARIHGVGRHSDHRGRLRVGGSQAMTARTYSILRSAVVVVAVAAVVVVLGSLPTEAQLRAAYSTPVSSP